MADITPLSTLGTYGELIHPPEKQFKMEARFHTEEATYKRLCNILGDDLLTRLRATVFGPFIEFYTSNWKYKGRLIAFLYFHMVYPDRDDELHFKVRDKRLKFGRREFAMIMGYRFGDLRHVALLTESRCFSDTCELKKCKSSITLQKIELVCGRETDVEKRYRMGLVYFIYGILMGVDPGTIIPPHIFYIIEDDEIVDAFPWGEFLYDNLMSSWQRIVQDCRQREPLHGKPHKPNFFGCLYALQLWCCQAMPNVAMLGKYASLIEGRENALPSFLRWRFDEGGVYSNTLISDKVKPWEGVKVDIVETAEDKDFVVSLGLPKTEVLASPRALSIPPIDPSHATPSVVDPTHLDVDPSLSRNMARDRRPDLDPEDLRRTQEPCVVGLSTSVDPQSIPIVIDVPLEELRPVIMQLVQTEVDKSNVVLRDELSARKAELGEVNAKLSEVATELGQLKQVNSFKKKEKEKYDGDNNNKSQELNDFRKCVNDIQNLDGLTNDDLFKIIDEFMDAKVCVAYLSLKSEDLKVKFVKRFINKHC